MRTVLTALAAILALLGPAVEGASGSAPQSHAPLGLVLHAGSHAPRSFRTLAASGASNLVYHNGPVMHTNTTYAIYWVPSGYSVDTNYKTDIDRYFSDVAADSGKPTNVYSVTTQYFDTSGSIQYQSTFGGSVLDTDTFPASGCTAAATCLTDNQLTAEIQHEIAVNGWTEGLGSLFFIMTPDGVASCTDHTNSECSTNVYCAYHSAFTDTGAGQDVVYANEPYDATAPAGCKSAGQGFPNDAAADATINTISHEMSESITDPLLDAWYGSDLSHEIGDQCAWVFGSNLGTTAGGQPYNQVINGDDYSVQQEYSNDGATCLQRYTSHLLPTEISLPVATGTEAVNQTLTTTTGSWSGSPTGYAYQWQRCSSTGANCVDIAGANGSTYTLTSADGGQTVRSTVSAVNASGAAAYAASAVSDVIVPLPAATVAPAVSGLAGIGRTLQTTSGTWNTPMTYAYQWLRCAADGLGCTTIPGATDATHVVMGGDTGHTLEARVTATNAAGSTIVASAPVSVTTASVTKLHAPRITGEAKAGRRLLAFTGTRSLSTASFRYHWLRCDARGAHCRTIRHATFATYVLHRADVHHRLRVRVTADRAAAMSAPTALVRS